MATGKLKSKTVGLPRLLAREVVGEFGLLSVPSVHSCVSIRLYVLHGTIATTVYTCLRRNRAV